jgi:hypothetical protein
MSNRPRRNDPCPCGSGSKFKKCHGSIIRLEALQRLNNPRMRQELQTMMARREAREFQRREQQGLGKPIISTQFQDHRIVAVGGTVHFSKKWKTFHDFLNDYPKIVLGKEWWMVEVDKPQGARHRILTWANRMYEQQKAYAEQHRIGVAHPATGAVSAYMRFAYDLYGLKHAVEVQKLLIERIKSSNNFPGALYEVRVAAALLRAGFELQFEDETDRRSTHVEFIAKHTASGVTYAVEAKRREGMRMKINKQMYRALSKQSDYPRIVFIDTNDGRLEAARDSRNPIVLVETENLLKRYERDPIAQTLPQAYVIATYDPEEHHLDAIDLPSGILLWGFHHEDLKPGLKTLLQQVQTRRRHAPIFALLESMQKHRHIPATFDGDSEAFLGGSSVTRLQVGQRMMVPKPDGTQVEVTLESGVVMPEWKAALCVVCSDDQQQFLVQIPLTDEELQAHAQHPTTFFGVIDRNAGRSRRNTGLDWFDFFWESYSGSSKEKLIELMKHAPDIDRLKGLTQDELAIEYCTWMANSMMEDRAESAG